MSTVGPYAGGRPATPTCSDFERRVTTLRGVPRRVVVARCSKWGLVGRRGGGGGPGLDERSGVPDAWLVEPAQATTRYAETRWVRHRQCRRVTVGTTRCRRGGAWCPLRAVLGVENAEEDQHQ